MQEFGSHTRLKVDIFVSRREKEAVSTTWDTGDENRETRPIRASTLADGSRLLAAFQVNRSSSGPALISTETEGEADCCMTILEGSAFFIEML